MNNQLNNVSMMSPWKFLFAGYPEAAVVVVRMLRAAARVLVAVVSFVVDVLPLKRGHQKKELYLGASSN